MNSSGCYIDSQGLRTAGKYLFPGFCRPGIFRFAGIFRVLWISHRNIGGEWQGVFRLADRSRIGRTTAEQGAAARMHGFESGRRRPHIPPPFDKFVEMRLLRSHADTRLPAIGEGDAVAAQWQMKNRSRLSISCDFISVCPGQDSNLHERNCSLPPQSSVSTNFTTWALHPRSNFRECKYRHYFAIRKIFARKTSKFTKRLRRRSCTASGTPPLI